MNGFVLAMGDMSHGLLLTLALGISALGLYLNLPWHPRPAVRWAGMGLIGLALFCLVQELAPSTETASTVVFAAAACVAIAAAVLTVTSPTVKHAAIGCLLLAVSNAVLMFQQNSAVLAGAAVVLSLGTIVLPILFMSRGEANAEQPTIHEAGLACVTGVFLAAVLIASFSSIGGSDSMSQTPRETSRSTQRGGLMQSEFKVSSESLWIVGLLAFVSIAGATAVSRRVES
jgi:NADH:ubiquinone oxidoreductase subunit 6 (subunit J)